MPPIVTVTTPATATASPSLPGDTVPASSTSPAHRSIHGRCRGGAITDRNGCVPVAGSLTYNLPSSSVMGTHSPPGSPGMSAPSSSCAPGSRNGSRKVPSSAVSQADSRPLAQLRSRSRARATGRCGSAAWTSVSASPCSRIVRSSGHVGWHHALFAAPGGAPWISEVSSPRHRQRVTLTPPGGLYVWRNSATSGSDAGAVKRQNAYCPPIFGTYTNGTST